VGEFDSTKRRALAEAAIARVETLLPELDDRTASVVSRYAGLAAARIDDERSANRLLALSRQKAGDDEALATLADLAALRAAGLLRGPGAAADAAGLLRGSGSTARRLALAELEARLRRQEQGEAGSSVHPEGIAAAREWTSPFTDLVRRCTPAEAAPMRDAAIARLTMVMNDGITLPEREPMGLLAVANARLERARILMLQGQAEAAAQALDRADDPDVWARVARHQMSAHDVDDMAIGRLRWQVLFGDPSAAADAAEAAAAKAESARRMRRALKLQLLQALALQRAGSPADLEAALALTGRLLQVAQAEGYVRLLLDEGPAVGTLLRRTQAALHASAERTDPLVDDCLQRLIALAGDEPLADEPAPAAEPAAPLATLDEPLTRKEIRVLQLLAEGSSNSAMAEKLFVSDSTVRTHLRNINLKLGARSRTQAVAIARKRGVI
jgi:DNA-binding NarL/FixJ family response regulator